MKKKMLNDKTIRAIAIGLSAVIATAQPMTVFAAEEGETPSDPAAQETTKPSDEKEAKAKVDNDTTVDKAKDQVSNVEYYSIESTTDDVAALKENMNAADQDMADTSAALNDADAANVALDDAKAVADDSVSSIAASAAKAYEAAKKANEDADTNTENINNATSIADANASYDKIVADQAAASAELEAAKEEYTNLKEEYDKAIAEVEAKKAAYDEALESSKEEIAAAKAELEDAQKNADAIKAKADAAIANFGAELEKPYNEAKAEYDEINAKSDLIGKIARKKDTVDKDFEKKAINYTHINDLVNLMLKYKLYDVADGDITISDWVKQHGYYKNTDHNYVEVTYNDKIGNFYRQYFDYTYDEKTGELTILEKSYVKDDNGHKYFRSKGESYYTVNQYNDSVANYDSSSVENAKAKMDAAKLQMEKDKAEYARLTGDSKAKADLAASIAKAQKEVDAASAKNSYNWRKADELVKLKLQYALYDVADGGVVNLSKFTYNTEGQLNNCVAATYTKNGETVTEYYDYVVYDESGVDVAVSKKYKEASIEIVKKELDTEKSTETNKVFTGKGSTYYTEDNYNGTIAARLAAYNALSAAAKTQSDRIIKAEKAVENIQNQINALTAAGYAEQDYKDLLADYQERLKTAEENRDKAQGELDEINEKLDVAKEALDGAIARLTPAATPRRNNNNNAPVVAAVGDVALADFVYAPGIELAANQAPVQIANGVQAAAAVQAVDANAAGDVINLDAAQTPLADFAEEDKASDAAAITLEDEATPLVDFAEKENMNWWWMIVVTVLGATGVALYRKHQLKKAKAESVKEK